MSLNEMYIEGKVYEYGKIREGDGGGIEMGMQDRIRSWDGEKLHRPPQGHSPLQYKCRWHLS